MQQLLFNADPASPIAVVPMAKRMPGRPPRSEEEKARIAAEREANKPPPNARGGARMLAGRPRHDGTSKHDEPGAMAGDKTTTQHYAEARARREAAAADKEEVLAKKAVLDYEVQQGNFLPRDAIISATARAYATLAQGIRSIPDALERRLGLDPAVCVKIGELQDEALAGLHIELEKMLTPEGEKGTENGQ